VKNHTKNQLKKQRKKKKMEYKQYALGKLQNMFNKEQNSDELNKIMRTISNKHDVLLDDNEETNNIQLKEEIYQQMNLIKLDDLNALPLKEIKRKLDKKYGKMATADEISEIGEEFVVDNDHEKVKGN